MIVDTSALVAVLYREYGYQALRSALYADEGWVPATVLVEFERVVALEGNAPNQQAKRLIALLLKRRIRIAALTEAAALAAVGANRTYGSGNGRGGKLNMLDLMVYGMATVERRPILCTGADFASTDAAIHPASRIDAQSSSSS